MPYTGPGDDKLPEAVQKLPEAKRAIWVNVWNSAHKKCLDEGGEGPACEASAFAQANGVAMKESADEALAEAATLKAKALALVRDMAALLEDRTLPEAVRKEIEDVRTALRRTWADLEADGTKVEDEADNAEAAQLPLDDAPIAETLGESAEGVEILSAGANTDDREGPLVLKVKLIEPGFGNKRDGHYYPAEMLKRDSHVFDGAMMFETDHVQGEKSTRTWVSDVRKVVGFSDTGAPIAEVVVHHPGFAKHVRNLAQQKDANGESMLKHLSCSILASGNVKRGKIDGTDARIVEAITDAQAVDWVTRAGAGGQALAIMSEAQSEPESNGGTVMAEETQQEPAVTPEPVQERLSETEAQAVLAEAQCNDAIKERLAAGSYANADALKAAIVAEVEYLKRVTGAGRVTDLGESAKAQPKQVTLAEVEDRVQKVNQKWGFGPARKPETKENQK
jgi:hypothetical protein